MHRRPVGSNIGALYQKLYIQSKSAPEDGRVCRPPATCRDDFKKSINGICCIFLLAYIFFLSRLLTKTLYALLSPVRVLSVSNNKKQQNCLQPH